MAKRGKLVPVGPACAGDVEVVQVPGHSKISCRQAFLAGPKGQWRAYLRRDRGVGETKRARSRSHGPVKRATTWRLAL